MDWANEVDGSMEAWIKVMSSVEVRQSSETVERIKSELRRRQFHGTFEEDLGFPYLGCFTNIASI